MNWKVYILTLDTFYSQQFAVWLTINGPCYLGYYASSNEQNLPENTQELFSLIVPWIVSSQNSAVQNSIFLTLKELVIGIFYFRSHIWLQTLLKPTTAI